MSLFKMARQAAEPTPDLLWLAAVSLAGYHDLGLTGEVEYGRLAFEELNDVLTSGVDFDGTPDDDDEGRSRSRSGLQLQGLRFEKDLRLALYKHWNLEESMLHSPYFYGTL